MIDRTGQSITIPATGYSREIEIQRYQLDVKRFVEDSGRLAWADPALDVPPEAPGASISLM